MIKLSLRLFITVCFVLSVSCVFADERSSKHLLDNGMTVLITEMPSSPVVSVYALVQTGSATEGKFLGTGISHFLEHMLFKGTHGRGVGEIAARVQGVGGTINASTGKDYTMYKITVPFDHFDTALDILADMLMNAVIEQKEVERERNVIFGEMRMNRDNPDRRISELVYQNVYIRHPYQHPIIGYETLLAQVSEDDLVEYYETFYTPNNTIFSVSGNIDGPMVLAKVKEAFKDFERGSVQIRNLPLEPKQIIGRHYVEEYPTDLTRLALVYPSTSLLHSDLYAMDVLAKILGSGRSSRLYLDVYKNKKLVHSVSSYNYTPIDQGVFRIDCLLDQVNIDEAMTAIKDQIAQIKQSGLSVDELAKAKQQVKSDYVFHHQTASSVAYSSALDQAFSGDHLFSQKYVEAINSVTQEDILRVANAYLNDSRLTSIILKPKQDLVNTQLLTESSIEQDIAKHVLDNGLTLLIKEDKTFPLVNIRVSANGGVRQEPDGLNGLSSMMASAWIKGTKNLTANEIAEKTESRGMRLGQFSGRNSFGISLELLTEHLPDAWNLMNDLIHEPLFPESEMDIIKENMRTIIRQRQDNVFRSTAHELKKTLFLTHPFRLEKEGSLESVDRTTRDDLVSFYEQFVVPSNMVISVFGDIDAQAVLKDVKRMFGAIKSQPVTLKKHSEEPSEKTREVKHTLDKEQAMVMMGFQGVALNHDDQMTLDVLTSILGSSFSGRIFNTIREQMGNAYTLGGDFIPGPDSGFIYFYVLTSESEVQKVKELLEKEIKRIQSKLVPDDELNAMKTYLKGTFKASLETNSSLSMVASLDELYGLGFDHHKKYDDDINHVTAEDVRRCAQGYLDLNKMAVVITTPATKK